MLKRLFKKTDFTALFDSGAILLDVRNPNETATDRIKDSMLIPLPNLATKLNEIKTLNKPIVCVCASGVRSGMDKAQLKANGIEAYNGGSYIKIKKIF